MAQPGPAPLDAVPQSPDHVSAIERQQRHGKAGTDLFILVPPGTGVFDGATGGLIAAAAGIAVGAPSLRLKGLYLAVATSLSSTLIVVKLLSDKFERATFGGRVTLGILVFQDLFAIVFLAAQRWISGEA